MPPQSSRPNRVRYLRVFFYHLGRSGVAGDNSVKRGDIVTVSGGHNSPSPFREGGPHVPFWTIRWASHRRLAWRRECARFPRTRNQRQRLRPPIRKLPRLDERA